jgi:hypothetical protein
LQSGFHWAQNGRHCGWYCHSRFNRPEKEEEEEIATLRAFLPICAQCKKIRNGEGIWDQVENDTEERSPVLFSHSLCPQCVKNMYGKESWYKKQ